MSARLLAASKGGAAKPRKTAKSEA
jgi:hypothetical protein